MGLRFEGEKGDNFFRSTLVQTLFYGIFSAWVLWSKKNRKRKDKFDWRNATWELHVPMIKALFEQVATPTKLEAADLVEVLDWTGDVLNRVDREAFFANFEEGHAVQYFYEPFLQAFDPELRKQLGVWFTPTEIVKYMVARVDVVLREELKIADGLADPRVYVLDPSCGTGAYLVEVLHKIHETLKEKGEHALAAHDLKRAAMERVFGFEILPAPFVVSHLQLGLLLQNLGAPLAESMDERVGVYLTNALTGWEPPSEEVKARLQQLAFSFSELKEEHDAAERVKRETNIIVILGNPPYNGYAGVAMGEERDLTTAYRTTIHAPKPSGSGLNNLYVRFFRMAERRIVEQTGEGLICFISPYAWLKKSSFPGMREKYLSAFDEIWIDSLNGDKHETGKLTPDGKPDPSVFSTESNREGIQVGTAISLLIRKKHHEKADGVHFREWWGTNKRTDLLVALTGAVENEYRELVPSLPLGLPFIPLRSSDEYQRWPLLPALFPISFPGVKTSIDELVVDIDRDDLISRIEKYFDPKITNAEIGRMLGTSMESANHFDPESTRTFLLQRGFFLTNIVRYQYRPMDMRWLYWEPETKLLDRKRSEYFAQVFSGNLFLFTTGMTRKSIVEPALVTNVLNDLNCMDSGARGFPLFLKDSSSSLFESPETDIRHNLSEEATKYLQSLSGTPMDLFFHCLASLHSLTYRRDNIAGLRQDWPRIPLPSTQDALVRSAELGRKIAALLDSESGVIGVTYGTIIDPFRSIGTISHVNAKSLNPEEDLKISAGWGHMQGSATMPGKGRLIERDYSPEDAKQSSAELSKRDCQSRRHFHTLGSERATFI